MKSYLNLSFVLFLVSSADGKPFDVMAKLHNLVFYSIKGDPGAKVVNHVNGVEGGNQLSNLNLLTGHQNSIPLAANKERVQNRATLSSVTRVMGVIWNPSRGFFKADVNFKAKTFSFAYFADKTLKENDMFALVICLVARIKLEK